MSMFLNFLRSIMPSLTMLAKLTPTPVDDSIVAIITALVNNPDKAPAIKASLVQHGAMAP